MEMLPVSLLQVLAQTLQIYSRTDRQGSFELVPKFGLEQPCFKQRQRYYRSLSQCIPRPDPPFGWD